jgi:DNA-binding MarR family transcriptional regulator
MSTSNATSKIGTVFYVIWACLHLLAANSVYVLGRSLDPSMVQGRVFQDAFNLLFFSIIAISVAVTLNWRNSVWGYWINFARAELCKQGDLMSGTGIAVGYLTRLLDDLEAKGMIRRHRSSEHRRQILLALTDSGKSVALALLAPLGRHERNREFRALEDLKSSLESFVSLFLELERAGQGNSPVQGGNPGAGSAGAEQHENRCETGSTATGSGTCSR